MNDSNQFLRKSPPVKARTTVNFTDPEQSSRLIQHVAEALNKKISNDEEITNTDIAKALHILLMVVGASEFQRSRKIQPAAIVPKVSLH